MKAIKSAESNNDKENNQEHSTKTENEYSSIIERNLHNIELRDTFVKILQLCPEFSISDIICNDE